MKTTSELIKNLKRIAQRVFKDTPVLFAYLYGSYAAGLSHSFSDLDVGIYVPPMSTKDKMNLEMSLALTIDKGLERKVNSDVRTVNGLPLAVAGEIVTKGMIIYCRDDKIRIDYETVIRSSYFDFLPFLRKYQRNYLKQIS